MRLVSKVGRGESLSASAKLFARKSYTRPGGIATPRARVKGSPEAPFTGSPVYLSAMLTVRGTPSPRSTLNWYVPAVSPFVPKLKMYCPSE